MSRYAKMGMNMTHTMSNASTKIAMKFSEMGNLASAMIDVPARMSIKNRGCINEIAMPSPNNFAGPSRSIIDMNFGGGVSGSSSPKKDRTARISNNKPKIKKKIFTMACLPIESTEDI